MLCERSEAIQNSVRGSGLLRFARNDDEYVDASRRRHDDLVRQHNSDARAAPRVLSGLFAFATSLDQVVPALVVARPNQGTPARRTSATSMDNISPVIVAPANAGIIGATLLSLRAAAIRQRTS